MEDCTVKKKFICICTMLCILSLAACSASTPHDIAPIEPEDTPEVISPEIQPNEPMNTVPIDAEPQEVQADSILLPPLFSDDTASLTIDVRAQSNVQNQNTFYVDGSWIYGQSWDENGVSQLIKTRSDFSDWTVLDDCFASYITSVDNYIYYMGRNDIEHGVYRVRTSGEDLSQLSTAYGAMQVVGNYIYYTDSQYIFDDEPIQTSDDAHLFRCDLDGTNVIEVIAKPVFHFYVFENGILYQDDQDNSTLHVCYTDGSGDIKLNDAISYWPTYDGEYIYYVREEELFNLETRSIWKIKPDGSDDQQVAPYPVSTGMALSNDYIYFINAEDSDRVYRILKDGTGIELVTQDEHIMFLQLFNTTIKYTKYTDDGFIENNYIAAPDGSDKVAFEP